MTTADGTFVDRHTIRFELHYAHPRAAVWAALTDAEALALWFMPMEIDRRVGGKVVLFYRGPETPVPAEGFVAAFEPNALMEVAFGKGDWLWPEGTLRFELTDVGENETRLVFTQRVASDTGWHVDGQLALGTVHPGACAGWEGFFDTGLVRYLSGERSRVYREEDDAVMDAREEIYRQRLEALIGQ